MVWTLELASYLDDAPWPANKVELLDYATRTGAPKEVVDNLMDLEDTDEPFESIEEIWLDYPTDEDFFYDEESKDFNFCNESKNAPANMLRRCLQGLIEEKLLSVPFLPLYLILISFLFPTTSLSQQVIILDSTEYELNEVKFEFDGTSTFQPEVLKDVILTGNAETFTFIEVGQDIYRIETFYFDRGFFSARADTSIQFNKEDEEFNVIFTVKENERTYINEITYIGLDSIPQALKDSLFSTDTAYINAGHSYSKTNINLEIIRILKILHNNGYANATQGEVDIQKIISEQSELKNKANITIVIGTGKSYNFGTTTISIQNNKYGFSEEIIRRELQYREGELYSQSKITSTELRILSIALIKAKNLEKDSTENVININMEITLDNKYELTPEVIGYDIDNKFYGGLGLSFSDKYFFGAGRTMSSRLRGLVNSFDNNFVEFFMNIFQPYLFNNPNLSGNLRLGGKIEEEDGRYINFEVSNTTGVTYNLPTFTYINKLVFDWELKNQYIKSTDTIEANLNNGVNNIAPFDINIFLSQIGVTAFHTTVNSPVFPTAGMFQSFGIKESGGLGSLVNELFSINTFKFVSLYNLNKTYLNLSSEKESKSVLAIKFAVGNLFEYGDNEFLIGDSIPVSSAILPLDAKFTTGGSTSNRGWKSQSLGFVSDQEIGGNFLIEGSFELRQRPFIHSQGFLKDIGFALFTDYGNVWENASDFRTDQIAISIGTGVRYFTVIGAIRIDFGFKLYDPNPGPVGGSKWIFQKGANFNDKWNIQFGIGNTF